MITVNLIEKLLALFQQPNTKVAIFISGQGSNAQFILKQRYRYPNLEFLCIFTDQINSKAQEISKQFKLNYCCLPSQNNWDINQRKQYFDEVLQYLNMYNIDLIIYAGFMKIVSKEFLYTIPGINIHPADLTICNEFNMPKYAGMKAIELALANNESYLASTVHVVDEQVDCGKPIAVSKHLLLTDSLRQLAIDELHQQMKINCEYNTYPEIISRLSRGQIKLEQMPVKLNLDAECNTYNYFVDEIKTHSKLIDPLKVMFLAQQRCGEVGFDFTDIDLVFMKVKEEFEELALVYSERDNRREELELEIGDCFFSLVNLCRHLKIDLIDLLHKNINKFIDRCEFIEHNLKDKGIDWNDVSLEEIYKLWKLAKKYL